MKYRIVRCENNEENWFKVEKKSIFGWHSVYENTGCCIDGMGSCYDDVKFHSQEEAELYIKSISTCSGIVIKELNI